MGARGICLRPRRQPPGDPFEEAIGIIAEAFARFDPEMGDFVRMMAERGWIDTPPPRTGAPVPIAPSLPSRWSRGSSSPMRGTMDNVITLATSWGTPGTTGSSGDLPMSQRSYPMTLAETASIFAETLVRSAPVRAGAEPRGAPAIAWAGGRRRRHLPGQHPARFDLERALVAERESGYVSPARLRR